MNLTPTLRKLKLLHEDATMRLRRAIINRICNCTHPRDQVVQCDSMSPSVRLCCKCGVSEDGWGIGHVLIQPKAYVQFPQVTAKELSRGRSIATLFEQDKIQLLAFSPSGQTPKQRLRNVLEMLPILPENLV